MDMECTPQRSWSVRLEEVVRRRGGNLREHEVWAVLYEATTTLQDLFLKGEREEAEVASGREVELMSRGRVVLGVLPRPRPPAHLEQLVLEEVGLTVREALGEEALSPRLSALLGLMCRGQASLLLLLQEVYEYSTGGHHVKPFCQIIMDMYDSVANKKPMKHPLVKVSSFSSSSGSNGELEGGRVRPYRQRAPARYVAPNTVVGPEFVIRAAEPPSRILITNNKKGNMKKILVLLLNGKRVEVNCNPYNTTFGQVFKCVEEEAGVDYGVTVGLACLVAGELVMPPPETRLSKAAPTPWLEGLPSPFTLYLRFRIYLPDLRGVSSWAWKHMLYLQLRRNMLDGLVCMNETEEASLAALALQAEFGDYNLQEHGEGYFLTEHYLASGEGREEELRRLHEGRRGLDPGKAEEAFVRQVMATPHYGTHYFKASLQSVGGCSEEVWIGLNCRGLLLSGRPPSPPSHLFPWADIGSLSYTKTSFHITTKVSKHSLNMHKHKSFYLFRLAWLHHKFFTKMSREFTSLRLLSQELGESGTESEGRPVPSKPCRPAGAALRRAATFTSPVAPKTRRFSQRNKNKRSHSCREPRGEEVELAWELGHLKTKLSSLPSGRVEDIVRDNNVGETAFTMPNRLTKIPEVYVLNSSIKSIDEKFDLNLQESISESLAEKMDQLTINKRILTTVRLERGSGGWLGLQVTDGKDGGMYILSTVEGGPAHSANPPIHPGDQIGAVNGRDVMGLAYEEAMRVVSEAGNVVELVLYQGDRGQHCHSSANPGSSNSKQGLDLLASILQKPIEDSYKKVIRFSTESELDHLMMTSELPNLSYL